MQQSFREEYEARSPARKVGRSDQVDKEKLDESKRWLQIIKKSKKKV